MLSLGREGEESCLQPKEPRPALLPFSPVHLLLSLLKSICFTPGGSEGASGFHFINVCPWAACPLCTVTP